MIESLKNRPRGPTPIEIDLTGPQGNAFYLLSMARKLGRKLGYDETESQRILDEMMNGDYEELICTFDREFGSLVTLWR